MSEARICLDRSKAFSENRGDCAPDDPHYRVRHWQGQMMGKDMVLLPFDAEGNLVPDDGKTEPWQALNTDSKPVTHYPLYSAKMRELVEKKKKRVAVLASKAGAENEEEEILEPEAAAEEVNFVQWLKGEMKYEPHLLRTAAKKRFSKNYQQISQLVIDLVEDERLVRREEVCTQLARYLPAPADAA